MIEPTARKCFAVQFYIHSPYREFIWRHIKCTFIGRLNKSNFYVYPKLLTARQSRKLDHACTYRVACSVRQGKDVSIPLNSCEKSGILTLASSWTSRFCRKDTPQIFDLRRMALDKREQPLRIIIPRCIIIDQPVDSNARKINPFTPSDKCPT